MLHTIIVEARFDATHHVRLHDGTTEPPHEHSWTVRMHVSRPELDEFGMVLDFQIAQDHLRAVLADIDGRDLNTVPELARPYPTAEVLAGYLLSRICAGGLTAAHRVEVTEAPGCIAAATSDPEPDTSPD